MSTILRSLEKAQVRIKEYSLKESREAVGIRSYHSVLTPRRRTYNAHHHTECELSVFLSGAGTYTVGEKEYSFRAGDVFLFASDEEHCITEIKEKMDLLNVQFEPYILWENPDAMELTSLFNARNPSFENRFADKDGIIRGALSMLEEELRLARPCYSVAVRYHLFFALATLIRESSCVDLQRSLKASDNITQSIKLAIDYIQHNLERELTLCEIAEVACLSPTYFSYVFKKFNGISLWKYINIKRVERAVEMLKSENLTKLEIAERCGFSSSSNFYKIFAAVTGKTPSDYTK